MIEHLYDGTYRYTTKEFIKDCRDGVLTDHDGYGLLATYSNISEEVVKPSRVDGPIGNWPYVVFYRNKGRSE